MSAAGDISRRSGSQRVLVVGGSGFIGSRLCPKLAEQGHRVAILDKNPPPQELRAYPYVKGDVRNLEDLVKASANQDLIYNLAAEHSDDVHPETLYYDVNVTGAANVCRAAEQTGTNRIIFTSSVAVYGSSNRPMDEATPHNFFNEYGRTKHIAEIQYLEWLERGEDRMLTIVRPTVVFGPGNRGNVYNLIRQIRHGPFIMFGAGRNVKSVAHVENISGFLTYLASRPVRREIFNYADKPDLMVRDLVRFVDATLGRKDGYRVGFPMYAGLAVGHAVDALARLTGRTFPVSAIRVKKFCSSSEIVADAAFGTGFVPPVDLRSGLREMVLHEGN